MQIEKYDRKPFSVLAVQVNFENVHEVADWCKGTVIKQKAKMLGVNTDVPAVQLQGQGDSRGKAFIATLGCYIVELKGSFRVYKPGQFDSAFQPAAKIEAFNCLADGSCCEEAAVDVLTPPATEDNSSVDGQETVVSSL